jgi:hypothetical protein
MADGSGTTIETAAPVREDTAREARAEVTGARKAKKGKLVWKKAGPASERWHEFVVNVWITHFNSIEFGLYKRSRNKAKSRQFTSDMDIFAEVIENGARTGLLGYREDLWKNNVGMDKRLVFKLFGENLNWRATMDLMIGRSLQLTLGARGLPVTAFSINVGDHDHMVYLERSANKWRFLPENFSFFLMEDGRPEFFRLRSGLIDLAGDYTLFDEHDRAIGSLHGKVFSIGGKWKARIRKERADPRLLMVLKLFCGMLLFNAECRRHMQQLTRLVLADKYKPKLEKQEAELYMNPRRVR